jgi:hypothetical protein
MSSIFPESSAMASELIVWTRSVRRARISKRRIPSMEQIPKGTPQQPAEWFLNVANQWSKRCVEVLRGFGDRPRPSLEVEYHKDIGHKQTMLIYLHTRDSPVRSLGPLYRGCVSCRWDC